MTWARRRRDLHRAEDRHWHRHGRGRRRRHRRGCRHMSWDSRDRRHSASAQGAWWQGDRIQRRPCIDGPRGRRLGCRHRGGRVWLRSPGQGHRRGRGHRQGHVRRGRCRCGRRKHEGQRQRGDAVLRPRRGGRDGWLRHTDIVLCRQGHRIHRLGLVCSGHRVRGWQLLPETYSLCPPHRERRRQPRNQQEQHDVRGNPSLPTRLVDRCFRMSSVPAPTRGCEATLVISRSTGPPAPVPTAPTPAGRCGVTHTSAIVDVRNGLLAGHGLLESPNRAGPSCADDSDAPHTD
jgi:hypothetical protein